MTNEVCDSRFLPLPKAAVYSGMSASTLRRLVDAGKLTLFRPHGRVTLLDKAELDALVGPRCQGAKVITL